MFNSNGVSLADIAAVTGNNRNNDGMWGDGAWWIVILLIFGWGNNGWGGFGGNGNGAGYTDSAIQRGFDNQAVISNQNSHHTISSGNMQLSVKHKSDGKLLVIKESGTARQAKR